MHSFTKNDIVNRLLNSFRIFLCISIVMSVFNPVMIASASSGASLSVGSDTVDVGDTSVVSISLGNCSNVTDMNFTLNFDSSILELIGVEKYSGVTGILSNTSSPSSVGVELNGMNFTEISDAPVVDVRFKGNSRGNSTLDITSANLVTIEGSNSPTINDGSMDVVGNSAPVLAAIGNQTVNETEPLAFIISATDADGDSLTYSASNLPTGAEFNVSTQTFNWTPSLGENSTYNNVLFNVTDGTDSDNETITITVNPKVITPTNTPPVFTEIGNQTVYETEPLTFTISATDAENDSLVYSAFNCPSGSLFNTSTHEFSWTPTDGQSGTYTVQFNVTDSTDFASQNVSITVNDDLVITPTSSGGSGGGSQSTGEKFENIDFKDYNIKSVVKDRSTVFSFVNENNSIVSLSFVSVLNGGQTKTIIEVLKDTSSLVSGPAPGVVYKNMNIWVGDGKFVPAMVSDANIMFKVEKSWIEENKIDPSSITLCRYSGSWATLTTSSTGEDDTYLYFIAESPGFSPFAISSVNEWDLESTIDDNGSPTNSEDEQSLNTVSDDQLPAQPNTENQETKSSGIGITLVILLGIVGIGLYGYRNRDYYSKVRTQFGNPDGKRYRRIKR